MLAKVRQLPVDKRARRLRNEHLAAVTGGGDPRREVDVLADITLAADVRAPRVQAHAHADRTRGQRPLALAGGLDRLGRRRERIKKCVPLCVDLHAAVPGARPRSSRRCSASASSYPSAPSSLRRRVEPSISVKSKVTVPVGSS
jgi:hypothetical protein